MNLDPETRARLIGIFVSEAEETIATLSGLSDRLRGAVGEEDLSEFGRVAHGLKGAAGALGMADLAATLHDLEALSISLRGAGPADRADRQSRMTQAIEVLGAGIARMAASGEGTFPSDLLASARGLVSPGSAAPVALAHLVPTPAKPIPVSAEAPPAPSASERISVPADEVDEALRLASSLARSAALLQERLGTARGSQLATAAQAVAAGAQRLETAISSLRLLPAESAFSGLDAEVAQLADQLGKRVVLCFEGGEVRADRRTLQSARWMLRHLVRNAIDHAIEPPAERRRLGKPEAGRLSIHVEAAESALRVRIEDDGAGFDVDAIRRRLAERSADADAITALSDAEVLQRFAVEGGTTRDTANEISGRGLGLSAVASMARAIDGSLQVSSVRGKGATVSFLLPLELYAAEVLTVSIGQRMFGIPIVAVERTLHLGGAQATVQRGPTGLTLAVGEWIVPLHRLVDLIGSAAESGTDRFAIVLRSDEGVAAVAVDEIGEVLGVVPLTVQGIAEAQALVTGLAQLADGAMLEVLNPSRLVAASRRLRPATAAPVPRPSAPAATAASAGASAIATGAALEVVLAEDSLATREVLRVLLQERGFRVRLAADGEEALARVAEHLPDVVVSDVNMPRRDGLALARALRAGAATARLPIILLTSQDDDAARAAGAAAGADAYLIKSRFNAAVLEETLARLGVRKAR